MGPSPSPKSTIFLLLSLTVYFNFANSQNVQSGSVTNNNNNILPGQQYSNNNNYQAQSQPLAQQSTIYQQQVQQPLYTNIGAGANDQLAGGSAPAYSHAQIPVPHAASYDAIAKHAASHQHPQTHGAHHGHGAVDNGWKEPTTMTEYLVLGLPVLFLPALLLALMYLIWAGTYSSHYFHNQYDGPDEWHTTNPGKEHHGHSGHGHGHKGHHGVHHERSLNDLTSTVLKSIEKPLS